MSQTPLTLIARAVFWLAAVFTLAMALLPAPPQLPGEPGDKIQHIMAFAVLTALASLAYPRIRPAVLFAALAALGALIEVLQSIPSLGRDAEWADWLADSLAIAAVLSIAALLRRLRG
jgi:VanZ family protein